MLMCGVTAVCLCALAVGSTTSSKLKKYRKDCKWRCWKKRTPWRWMSSPRETVSKATQLNLFSPECCCCVPDFFFPFDFSVHLRKHPLALKLLIVSLKTNATELDSPDLSRSLKLPEKKPFFPDSKPPQSLAELKGKCCKCSKHIL